MNGEVPLGDLRARAVWRAASINVSNVEWHLEDTHAIGKLSVNLAKAEPAYQLNGTMENFDYRNGQLDVDGEFITSGTGADLLINLRSKGTFEGRGIVLAPDAEMRAVSGAYRVAASQRHSAPAAFGSAGFTGRRYTDRARLQPARRPSGPRAYQRAQAGTVDRNAAAPASRTRTREVVLGPASRGHPRY